MGSRHWFELWSGHLHGKKEPGIGLTTSFVQARCVHSLILPREIYFASYDRVGMGSE